MAEKSVELMVVYLVVRTVVMLFVQTVVLKVE